MIKQKITIESAICDACGGILNGFKEHGGINYGSLKGVFGYGSTLDGVAAAIPREFQVCERCWTRALRAIRLPATYEDRRWWHYDQLSRSWKRLKRPRNLRQEEQKMKRDMAEFRRRAEEARVRDQAQKRRRDQASHEMPPQLRQAVRGIIRDRKTAQKRLARAKMVGRTSRL